MILETKHYINGIEIRPLNFDEIGFKIDYSQDYNLPEINTDSVILVNEAKQLVIDHINTLGVFEGIPYSITFGGVTLNYYIDLTDNPLMGDSQIEVKIKRRKSVLNFMDKANGLSFELLNKTHPITTVMADYIIVQDNQGVILTMLLINTFTLAKESAESIVNVAESAMDVVKASTPNIGFPSVDLGDIIAAVVLLVARIVYAAFILIQILEMIKQMLDILVPTIRQFKASTVLELINKGCTKLGYTFQSSLVDSKLAILPVPLANNKPSVFEYLSSGDSTFYTKGYPTALDSTPTLGNLMDFVKNYYNADLSVIGSVVKLEQHTQTPSTIINNTLNIQSTREDSYSFNSGESWKRYLVKYRFDISDLHSLNNYQKGQAEYSTEPINVVNADLVNIKGLVSVDIPFALGVRKNSLNYVESKLLKFAQYADTIVSLFGGNSNYVSKINARKGVIQVSQQQFSQSKLLYLQGTKQPINYLDIIGAKAVYNNHISNEVKENFKRIYTSSIPLSSHQFNEIINGGNTVKDSLTDEILEIITIEWINEGVKATINYSVKGNEAFNTKTITVYE